MSDNILTVENMHIHIPSHTGVVKAVRGVSMGLGKSETLAIVGESGCGKTMTVKGIMRLLPCLGKIVEGSVTYDGVALTKIRERQMQQIRGGQISMIFQDPMTSLNPTMTVEKQISEIIIRHDKSLRGDALHKRVVELLQLVEVNSPEKRCKQYPHQFSGGMRQRVIIAIAIACNPKILIADEPTTALDVTIQAQILDLMRSLQKKMDMSIIMITHNLGIVANIADRVIVMYGGVFVESGTVDEIFYNAKHPYTRGLLLSIPNVSRVRQELHSIPGTPPDLIDPPAGCPFVTRCPYAMKVCKECRPDDAKLSKTHTAACWLLDERARGHAREVSYES